MLDKIREAATAWAPDLIAAALTLILGWFGARLVRALLRRAMNKASVDPILVRFTASLSYVGLMAMVLIAVLGRLGVNTTSFAAIIGAAGLAVGLAFKDSLSNFASGVLLIIFRPFQVGDFVEAADVSGSVEEIQVFTTVLKTPDNKKVIVGNAAITSASITNYAAYDTRRVDMVFGIGYGDDIPRAKQVLERILADDDRVLSDPEPAIAVSELADSSVNFVVRPWVATGDYWAVYFDVQQQVKTRFDAEGLSIPFPQRDLHLHQVA
ncbi:MAG: mechanosensitive ion channel protein [Deltaproteobacteria bacterium]|jgi:small conductance mechanosensitive channel|nr:mechanosensitive ion channel protein [Deltaproteobacteria bacterium]